jgi:predicted ester cyclase
MSLEANKAMVRLICDEVFNQGNLAVAEEVFAANYVEHFPGLPSGLDGFKHFLTMLRAAFPDLHVTLEDLIGEGDQVVWRWTMHGTHQGELFCLPATGKQATWTEIQIGRFAGGKLVEHWMSFDRLDLLQQLGLAPSSREAR